MRFHAPMLVACLALAVGGSARAEGDLPNLTPRVPSEVATIVVPDPSDPDVSRSVLRFRTALLNEGAAPLDLLVAPMSPEEAAARQRQVLQCDRFAGPACLSYSSTGSTALDPTTGQHFIEVGSYELVPVGPDGPLFDAVPLASATRSLACIGDFDWDSRDPPDDQALYSPTITFGCATQLRQGITPGYGITFPDEHLVIDDVAPGIYGLVVTIDANQRFVESSDLDNRAWVVVDLREAPACEDGLVPVLASGVS